MVLVQHRSRTSNVERFTDPLYTYTNWLGGSPFLLRTHRKGILEPRGEPLGLEIQRFGRSKTGGLLRQAGAKETDRFQFGGLELLIWRFHT